MKLFALALALTLSSLASASYNAGGVDAEKINDNKTVSCENDSDVNKIGYRPVTPVVSASDASIKLSFGIAGLYCAKSEGKFTWELRSMNDDYTDVITGTTYNIRNSQAVIENANGVAVARVVLENKAFQMFENEISLNKILTSDQVKLLDAGEAVSVKLGYYNHFIIAPKAEGRPAGISTIGGAYKYTFSLQKNADGMIIASPVTIL